MERRKVDPVVLQLELDLYAAIDAGLDELSEDIAARILARSSAGQLQRSSQTIAEATALLSAFFVLYAAEVKGTNVAVARHAVAQAKRGEMPKLNKVKVSPAYVRAQLNAIEAWPTRVDNTFYTRPHPADGRSFNYRIKTINSYSATTVRNIVRLATRDGESVDVIANRVRAFLKPGYDTENTLSALKLQRRALSAKPDAKLSIRTHKIPYQARRLARSEVGNTYRAGEHEMYKDTIFADDSYDWLLSNRHVPHDICDDHAAANPYKGEDRPETHPSCLCSFAKRPVSISVLRERLRKKGVIE